MALSAHSMPGGRSVKQGQEMHHPLVRHVPSVVLWATLFCGTAHAQPVETPPPEQRTTNGSGADELPGATTRPTDAERADDQKPPTTEKAPEAADSSSATPNDAEGGDATAGDAEARDAKSEDAKSEDPKPDDAKPDDAQQPLPNDDTEKREEEQVDPNEDPYAGLNQTGSPTPPPEPGEEIGEGKWEKDYDGRPEGTRAEDVLIWIPRAPLYPVHLVLNYGVRVPIVYLMTKAEEHKVFQRVEDFFTFADGKAGFYPVALYDAGRGFWGGLNFFYNDLGREGHSLRATAGIGSNNWILIQAKDSWKIFDGDRGEITFSAAFHRNPTYAFTGLGPDTDIDDQSFFREEKIEGAVDLEVNLEGLNRFSMRADFRRARLGDGRDPSLFDSGLDYSDATGFDEHFLLGGLEMRLALDSRHPKDEFTPGSGIRFESWGEYNYGPGDTRLSFFRYGVYPTVLWDITGVNHVMKFGIFAEAVSKTGGEDVPYNELVTLGGAKHMRGFLPGRFRGGSALVYSIEYSWPLLAFADMVLFSEVGNAYNGFYDDFSHDKMALDWGTVLRSSFSREVVAWFGLGFGTNQFNRWDEGFRVDQVRVTFGATHRF